MCGRFTITMRPEELQREFPWIIIPAQMQPRYNIAPTQPVAVITNENPQQVDFYRWGLIPSWAKDISIGARLINARAETLPEKPSFRHAFARRRCLILADGFYEWAVNQKAKQPYYIRLKSAKPFAFAGLWENWQDDQGNELRSCTIITTHANELVSRIHERMPVILAPENYSLWLAKEEKLPSELSQLLVPYPAQEMIMHPISAYVNNPRHDDAECIKPLA